MLRRMVATQPEKKLTAPASGLLLTVRTVSIMMCRWRERRNNRLRGRLLADAAKQGSNSGSADDNCDRDSDLRQRSGEAGSGGGRRLLPDVCADREGACAPVPVA